MSLTREQLAEVAEAAHFEAWSGESEHVDADIAVMDAVLEAVAGHYEQMERSHPASDGPMLVYAYEVAQHLRSLLPKGQTNE